MAKYNSAMEVTFNDNDGGVGWSANPSSAYDVARYHRIFGKWRSRWIFFKRFWKAMMWLESYAQKHYHEMDEARLWVVKSEIPE